MKEFKKWFDVNREKLYYKGRPLGMDIGAEEGWKAALEWVLSEIYEHHEAMDAIEQELDA